MSVLRHIVTAGVGLAVALMATPMIVLQAQATKQAPPDLPFIREAASANLKEVRLGQLAQSKSSNPAVKEYGLRMVTDHNKLEQDLISVVSRNGIALKPALTPEHVQQIHGLLVGPSGEPFDQAYMTMMNQDHQTDVARFESESRDAASPEVRDFAARSLPILQQHLSLAQQVGRQVNVEVAATPLPPSKAPAPLPPSKVPPTQNPPVTNPNVQPAQGGQAGVRADNEFIREVGADNLLEARLAQLAESKGQSSAVKQLAQRIAADHNRLQEEWSAMASSNGQQFKPGIGKHHKTKLNELQKLSGRDFDRAYVTMVVRNHRDYIEYFEKEGRSAHSTQVRDLVNRDLPTLRSDFNQAKQVGAQIGADVNVTLHSERGSASK